MTFKDSSWLMSLVVAAQPHFRTGCKYHHFLGYGLYTDQLGDYVKKTHEGLHRRGTAL